MLTDFILIPFDMTVKYIPPKPIPKILLVAAPPELPRNGSGICPICFKDCTGDNRFTFRVPEGSRFEDPVEYCGRVSCWKELYHSGLYICTGKGIHEGCKDCSHAVPHYLDKKACNPVQCVRGETKMWVKCVMMNQGIPADPDTQNRLKTFIERFSKLSKEK